MRAFTDHLREAMHCTGLCQDSRAILPGDLFIARAGLTVHGNQFVDEAIARGACAVAFASTTVTTPTLSTETKLQAPCYMIPNSTDAFAALAEAFYKTAALPIGVIGVTGTNGKTSVTHFIAQWLTLCGYPCAVIGTVGNGIWPTLQPASHTTPDIFRLHRLLNEYSEAGASYVVMEVSSHALEQGRVKGVPFLAGVFTNLSRDHLDYHGDMSAYFHAKRRLFKEYAPKHKIIYCGDAYANALADEFPEASRVSIDAMTSSHTLNADGMNADVVSPWGNGFLKSDLLASFTLSNLLTAMTTVLRLGLPFEEVIAAASELRAVPGRLEVMRAHHRPTIVIDYAHTPDALHRVLGTLRESCPGKLSCVFGCGGNRDKGKRQEMGAIASLLADRIYLTNDNPRDEAPDVIIQAILEGVLQNAPSSNIIVEPDRAAAIQTAIDDANEQDYVLIAGKGHEDYQEVMGHRYPFSDKAVVQRCLSQNHLSVRGRKRMRTINLSDLVAPLAAALVGDDVALGAINTDSRTITPGQCFLALKGPNYNGHGFVEAAKQKGATSLIIDEPVVSDLPALKVQDTQQALTQLGGLSRSAFTGKVVALTGSCGKTTTKSLIAAILQLQGEVLATDGTKNNHIGVPLTLLRIDETHDFAVIEIGTSSFGEIKPLAQLTKPHIALITNARAVHLEGLKSVEGVSREKGEIYSGLPDDGLLIMPVDDEFTPYWRTLQRANQRLVTFGRGEKADVRALHLLQSIDSQQFTLDVRGEQTTIRLNLLGLHNVDNALAAAAVCVELGCSLETIRLGLESAQPVTGRLVQRQGLRGVRIIDDTYNANPTAVMEALRVLSEVDAKERWFVLGDMAELADLAEPYHREVGINSKLFGVAALWTLGDWAGFATKAFGDGATHFIDKQSLINALTLAIAAHPHPETLSILVKGSRVAQLEEVVDALLASSTEAVVC